MVTFIFFRIPPLVLLMILSNPFAQALFDSTELSTLDQFDDSSNTISMTGEVDDWDQSDRTQDYADSLFSG